MKKLEPTQLRREKVSRKVVAKLIISIGWLLAIYPSIMIIQIAAGLGALSIEVDDETGGAVLFMIIAIVLVICTVGAPLFAGLGHARKSLELRVWAVLMGIPAVIVAGSLYLYPLS